MSRCVISLTSVPPRFAGLGPNLTTLLEQGADGVELWLPESYRRFPLWDGTLPDLPEGICLRRTAVDLGPATKFLPALDALGRSDRLAVCDDDMAYGHGWLAALEAPSLPTVAVAGSTYPLARLALTPRPGPEHRIVQGFAGVLLCPGMVGASGIPDRDRMVDDIWLSARLAATGTKIHEACEARAHITPSGADISALQDAAKDGLTRAEANLHSARALRAELGIWA